MQRLGQTGLSAVNSKWVLPDSKLSRGIPYLPFARTNWKFPVVFCINDSSLVFLFFDAVHLQLNTLPRDVASMRDTHGAGDNWMLLC